MGRFHELKYDENTWAIKGDRDTRYTLVNKETFDTYNIPGDVIGIEQQDDGSFMVFKRILRDEWQIYRFNAVEGSNNTKTTFVESFRNFAFLTENTLLFDNKNVYDISKNAYVKEFDWISFKYNIDIYEAADGKRVMALSKKIVTTSIPNIYVMVIVDVEHFKPISQAYSSLRNKLFNLSDNFTFSDLVKEDEYYANIIDDITRAESINASNKGLDILLTQVAATTKIYK